jgi:hypothetical protein
MIIKNKGNKIKKTREGATANMIYYYYIIIFVKERIHYICVFIFTDLMHDP